MFDNHLEFPTTNEREGEINQSMQRNINNTVAEQAADLGKARFTKPFSYYRRERLSRYYITFTCGEFLAPVDEIATLRLF